MSRSKQFRLTAPEPYENDVHVALADALDKLLMPPATWFTYPAGASPLTPQQHAAHSRIGLKRGLPDIWILYFGVFCIELKRRGQGRLSKTRVVHNRRGSPRVLIGQDQMFPKLIASGGVAAIEVAYSVEEALGWIARWGIPLRPGWKIAA